MFDKIESLKRQYTDKYVIVDENCPELRRFKGLTGTVKTVNMSGRALVEFDGNNNIGWFDIELDYLKVIDQPLPKPEEKAGKKGEKPAAKAAPAEKPAAKAPAAGGAPKMSVADMLAAADPSTAKTEGATAKKEAAPAARRQSRPHPRLVLAARPRSIQKQRAPPTSWQWLARGKPAGAAPAKPAAPPAAEVKNPRPKS